MPKLTVGREASHPVELHFEDYGRGCMGENITFTW